MENSDTFGGITDDYAFRIVHLNADSTQANDEIHFVSDDYYMIGIADGVLIDSATPVTDEVAVTCTPL
jgi:hypothetical protein